MKSQPTETFAGAAIWIDVIPWMGIGTATL
jgi:hypothetical protein